MQESNLAATENVFNLESLINKIVGDDPGAALCPDISSCQTACPEEQATQPKRLVTIGIDMGKNEWVAYLFDRSQKKSTIRRFKKAGKENACYKWLSELLHRHGAKADFHVVYEAGRIGYTPARRIEQLGMVPHIIAVSKLQIVKYGKRVKTDLIDARFLAELDVTSKDLPCVYIPTVEHECAKGLTRELRKVADQVRSKNNRILSILERWPLGMETASKHHNSGTWHEIVEEWRNRSDLPELLPASELFIIETLINRMKLDEQVNVQVLAQIDVCEQAKRQACAQKQETYVVDLLTQYRGLADKSMRVLVWEVGDFSRFDRSKIGSWLGMTPTHWSSSNTNKEQGISKAGSCRLRCLMVELAWLWRRWQPASKLTQKYEPRLRQRGRARRTAIVALARELAEALRDLVVENKEITGAVKNRPLRIG